MYIVDRRLNPNSKSLENRQRFLGRAKEQLPDAVRQASKGRGIREAVEGGEVSIPSDGVREPHFHTTPGKVRDFILPGNDTVGIEVKDRHHLFGVGNLLQRGL